MAELHPALCSIDLPYLRPLCGTRLSWFQGRSLALWQPQSQLSRRQQCLVAAASAVGPGSMESRENWYGLGPEANAQAAEPLEEALRISGVRAVMEHWCSVMCRIQRR